MRRTLGIVLLCCIAFAMSSLGTEIVELNRSASVQPHPETGISSLRFTLWFEYSPPPARATFASTWTTYVIENGVEVLIETETRPKRDFEGYSQFISSCPWIPVEAGRSYRARLFLDDPENGIAYQAVFDYVAPLLFPVAVTLQDGDGDGRIDLEMLRDADLSSLALLYGFLDGETTQTATDVDLGELIAGSASVRVTYPLLVMAFPPSLLRVTVQGRDGTTVNWAEQLALIPLSSAAESAGIVDTLSLFDRAYVGRTFTTTSSEAPFGARTIFVEDSAWQLLESAGAEAARRAGG